MTTLQKIKTSRRMAHVFRLQGTKQVLDGYSLTEHGFQCCMLYVEWCLNVNEKVDANVMWFMLFHDNLETQTGDMLYPAKHTSEATEKAWATIEAEVGADDFYIKDKNVEAFLPTSLYRRMWKIIDGLELYMRTVDERSCGNNGGEMALVQDAAMGIVLDNYNAASADDKARLRVFIDWMEEYKDVCR